MNLLSIDPGIEKIGYAVFTIEKNPQPSCTYRASGLIITKKTQEHIYRLREIYTALETTIHLHAIKAMSMEDLFFFKNAKTVIKVAQAQGVISLLAAQQDIPLTLLTPLQIKQTITGYGVADKKAVHKMIQITLGQDVPVQDDDESDAIACGLAYYFLHR